MPPKAAIDIGSNSLLLTVLDEAGAIVHDEARVVGLGRGLGDRGLFAPDRIAAAMEVLEAYVATAKAHGVEAWSIKAAATSAARRAMNAETFFARVSRKLGLRVKIISGDEEARLTWLGSQRDLDVGDARILVIDLGGGSTELVLGRGEDVDHRQSLEIGSVRLTEKFLRQGPTGAYDSSGLADMRKYVDTEVARFALDPLPEVVVGVAGTVTTLAAMRLGLVAYDSARVHASGLTREDLARFTDQLLPADPEQRRRLAAVAPERGDYLLAGVTILDRVLAAAKRTSLVVSDRGLRFGLLM